MSGGNSAGKDHAMNMETTPTLGKINREFTAATAKIAQARGAMRLAVAIKAKLKGSGEEEAYPNLHYMSSEIDTAEEAVSMTVKSKHYSANYVKRVIEFGPRADEITAFLTAINDRFPQVKREVEAARAQKKAAKEQREAENEWQEKKTSSGKWRSIMAGGCGRRTFIPDDESY